jgi:hypothetical protein
MAIGLAERVKARRLAPFHVQLELEPSGTVRSTPGLMPIAGRVSRIFKGHGKVSVGDRLTFSVNVCRRGEETPPGAAYLFEDDLRHATYIEVYLDGTPPQCQIVFDECAILAGQRDDALMTDASVETLMETGQSAPPLRPRRWWRFWDA